jgi:hypothetical protein
MNRKILPGVLGAVALAWCGAALAGPADFSITLDQNWIFNETNNNTGVTGEVDWTIYQDGSGDYFFVFSIRNTTNDGSRITGFAWDFPAGVLQAIPQETYSSLGWFFEFNDGLPPPGPSLPGEGLFDACTYPTANCEAGGDVGIQTGDDPNWFWVKLDGATTAADWANVAACLRFISIGPTGADSDVACRGDANGNGNGNGVPEPGTLALLGAGLIGLGIVRRRKLFSA